MTDRRTASDLFSSDDRARWSAALAEYDAVVAAMAVSGLADADAWYRRELPGIIASRTPPHLTLEELARTTEWKMKRGVWRLRNLSLVKGNPPDAVRARSEAAFAQIPDPRKPVATLAELEGVGPATASAVLAARRPDIYPFFDEIVAQQVPGLGAVNFTIPYYLRYAERLRARAAELGAPWTAHDVAQALFAAAGGKPAR